MVATTTSRPMQLRGRNVTRTVVALVATSILLAAFLAPWWTRDVSVNFDDEQNPRTFPGAEGIALSYGPFSTPGAGGFSTDGSREAAVSVLGIAFVMTVLLAQGSLATRLLKARGTIETDDALPVRLAIAAFVTGVFAILWAALFLPLLGDNPGWLYGPELSEGVVAQINDGFAYIEAGRYANAGFFLGIAGLIGYPAFLWADAASTRNANRYAASTPTAATRGNTA